MQRIKSFIFTSVLGGLTVILPIAVIIMVFNWVFWKVTNLIQPVTNMLMAKMKFHISEVLADLIVIGLIIVACFLVGLIERTKLGHFIFKSIEDPWLLKIPGYKIIKETILQFIGDQSSPFSSVALARIFGNQTKVTCFVTDEHPDGSYTVFVPTGPNPTSGNIYHLEAQFVQKLTNCSVEDTMRSIIACGAGSKKLLS
ncbi:MAG: DUF502 domain-containing protein [Bacteriovoracaceae bacterium]|nr:DUF502 domain-containing protein [Bacteriovoracaceae bacterium]